MSKNRPPASTTGRQEWRWSRPQAEKQPREDRKTDSKGTDRKRLQSGYSRTYVLALEREVRELEAELEQKEKHLQSTIQHYERLLDERNQLVREAHTTTESDGQSTAFSTAFRRFLNR